MNFSERERSTEFHQAACIGVGFPMRPDQDGETVNGRFNYRMEPSFFETTPYIRDVGPGVEVKQDTGSTDDSNGPGIGWSCGIGGSLEPEPVRQFLDSVDRSNGRVMGHHRKKRAKFFGDRLICV